MGLRQNLLAASSIMYARPIGFSSVENARRITESRGPEPGKLPEDGHISTTCVPKDMCSQNRIEIHDFHQIFNFGLNFIENLEFRCDFGNYMSLGTTCR